jgi:hypothetical protein
MLKQQQPFCTFTSIPIKAFIKDTNEYDDICMNATRPITKSLTFGDKTSIQP